MNRVRKLARASAFVTIVVGTLQCSDGTAPHVTPPPPLPPPPPPTTRSLLISGLPGSVTAGDVVSGTITAKDASGATVAGYRGTVRLTSSDPGAQLPATHTFVSGDSGTYTFTLTLRTAGTQSVTATDTSAGSIHGSRDVAVSAPARAAALVISGIAGAVNVATAVSGTITVKDAAGATVTGYRGTIRFTSSDPAARLPANHTFVAADQGSYIFTLTFQTAGTQTVTAADTITDSIQASRSVAVISPITATNVFAVGMHGTILHYDGTSWTRQLSDSTIWTLDGVWGSAANDVFAVGSGGTVLHYDGTRWSRENSNTTTRLNAIWGSSGTDVFAVGDQGTILHYDGTSWVQQMRDTTFFFESVWGSSPSNVFAVGNAFSNGVWSSLIFHYDGTSWTTQQVAANIWLFGLWGSSAGDVFAVGDSILHYDGTSWIPQRISELYGVWGASSHDVYAVGDYASVMHYDGTTWKLQIAPGEGGSPWEFDGVWGSSATDVFTVGQAGAIWHYDGIRWAEQTRGSTDFLWSVWGPASASASKEAGR